MLIPTFITFQKEVFNKLSDKEKSVLFFWSLLDPSSWEETEETDHLPNPLRGRRRVLNILKNKSLTFKKSIKKYKDFDKKFIWNEFLTNYLLTAQLQKEIKKEKLKGLLYKNLRQTTFPDLKLRKELEIIPIEIKGMIACSNLKDRLKDEVIENIKKNKKGDEKYKTFLLILLFPLCLKENYFRINQLVEGYYVYEELVNLHTKIKCNVLCQCISEKYNDKYSLSYLSKRIRKVIYGI